MPYAAVRSRRRVLTISTLLYMDVKLFIRCRLITLIILVSHCTLVIANAAVYETITAYDDIRATSITLIKVGQLCPGYNHRLDLLILHWYPKSIIVIRVYCSVSNGCNILRPVSRGTRV